MNVHWYAMVSNHSVCIPGVGVNARYLFHCVYLRNRHRRAESDLRRKLINRRYAHVKTEEKQPNQFPISLNCHQRSGQLRRLGRTFYNLSEYIHYLSSIRVAPTKQSSSRSLSARKRQQLIGLRKLPLSPMMDAGATLQIHSSLKGIYVPRKPIMANITQRCRDERGGQVQAPVLTRTLCGAWHLPLTTSILRPSLQCLLNSPT